MNNVPTRDEQVVLSVYHKILTFVTRFANIVIFSESMPSEMLIALLTIMLGLLIADPSKHIITPTSAYASLLALPFDPKTTEMLWGALFCIVGIASVVGVVNGSRKLRQLCTGASFTFWMFLFTMTVITAAPLGWAYNFFFAVAQFITFVQLSARKSRTVEHE